MRKLFRYAPVRIAAQAGLMVALGVLPIVLVAEPLSALGVEDRPINMIIGPLLTLAAVGSVAIAARFFDRRPLREYGLVLDGRACRGLLAGILVSAVVMSMVFAVEWLAGWITITGFALPLAFTLVKVICVGIYEEVYTRGYLLRNIADATSLPTAVIATSALFAVLHAFSPNASAGGIAALFANGLWFAAGYLLTGRLSTSIGLHASWNFFEGAVFGFPVSGDKEPGSLIAIAQHGPAWLTGGAFGPEGGVAGVAAAVMGILLLVVVNRRSINPS